MLLSLFTIAMAWTPTPGEEQLVRALSARDGAPPCIFLDELVQDPVVSLQRVVENISMPPWAPMEAARCLIENHSEEAEPTLKSWLATENTAGLAKMVVLSMGSLPAPLALRLTEKAVKGPHAKLARARLRNDPRPAIRTLAEQP